MIVIIHTACFWNIHVLYKSAIIDVNCELTPPLFRKKNDKQTLGRVDTRMPCIGSTSCFNFVNSWEWRPLQLRRHPWRAFRTNGWLGIPWGFKTGGEGVKLCSHFSFLVCFFEYWDLASGKWWQVMIVDRLWALIVVSIWGKSMLLTLKCKCSQVAVGDRRVLIVPIMVSWAKDVDSVQRWLCTLHRMVFFGNQKRVAKWLIVIFVPPIMHNYRLCTIKITKYDVLEANDSANDIQVNDPQHGLEANT